MRKVLIRICALGCPTYPLVIFWCVQLEPSPILHARPKFHQTMHSATSVARDICLVAHYQAHFYIILSYVAISRAISVSSMGMNVGLLDSGRWV